MGHSSQQHPGDRQDRESYEHRSEAECHREHAAQQGPHGKASGVHAVEPAEHAASLVGPHEVDACHLTGHGPHHVAESDDELHDQKDGEPWSGHGAERGQAYQRGTANHARP